MAWVLYNPLEFALFTGVPTSILLVAACGAEIFRRREGKAVFSCAPWTLLGVLLVLDVSGKNLGETARLWMFLMPLAAVGASSALAALDRRRGWRAGIVILLGTVQLIVFQYSFDVFRS